MVKYSSLIGTGVHTPSLRFRERIVGALKTKGVVLTEIAPTAANLNLAKAGSGLADCFGLSRDAKERKVVVQDVLRRMVTEKGKVLPGWGWVRDVSALNSLSTFDKITKMVASAARFANGTASIRKSVGVLADQKVAIALFKHAVRRGLVSCLLKIHLSRGAWGTSHARDCCARDSKMAARRSRTRRWSELCSSLSRAISRQQYASKTKPASQYQQKGRGSWE